MKSGPWGSLMVLNLAHGQIKGKVCGRAAGLAGHPAREPTRGPGLGHHGSALGTNLDILARIPHSKGRSIALLPLSTSNLLVSPQATLTFNLLKSALLSVQDAAYYSGDPVCKFFVLLRGS